MSRLARAVARRVHRALGLADLEAYMAQVAADPDRFC